MSARTRAFSRLFARRGPALGLYALAVILVPLGLVAPSVAPPPSQGATVDPVDPVDPVEPRGRTSLLAEVTQMRVLSGIWWRYEAGLEGEPVRFYYFHGDGTGLYRYGKVGLTNTHSFDYDVVGDRLVLDFRKSGEHYDVPFTLRHGPTGAEGRDWLELRDDPREPGSTRYFRESTAIVEPGTSPSAKLGPAPAGHMWIDLQQHATGGRGFVLYQLRAAGIDGRGVGWFHRGDFDDWSTEALTYRIVGGRLELHFSLAERSEVTSFVVRSEDDGARWLELDDDPRDFWHPHRYVDIGPSFGATLAPWALERSR